ncbi:MAG: hypothetical protein JWM37_298 [Candidatus Saccharibacteria bacterium]|nr:hypothetical protein [Candidatus Saccharibacteria bacterium]
MKHLLSTHKLYATIFIGVVIASLGRIPLGTFNNASPLDTFSHFILPATGAPLVVVYLATRDVVRMHNRLAFVFITVLLGTSVEAIWEIEEFIIDALFTLQWQLGNTDTMIDVILAVAGSAVGAIIFTKIYKEYTNEK